MKNLKIIGLLIISILLITSCNKDITDELKSKMKSTYTRLIVDGTITTDTMAHTVRLTKSVDYFYNSPPPPVSNANVSITDGISTFKLTEDSLNPGYYNTEPNVYGIPGHTYTLNISNVDIDQNGQTEIYSATSKLNPVGVVDSVYIKIVQKFGQYIYEIRINAQDPGNTRDYYMYKVRKNNVLITDTITEAQSSDDEFFNGSYAKNQPVYYLWPGKNDEHLKIGDTITLETCGITKDYQKFLFDLLLESQGSDPFGGQPANVSTNVEDKTKAMGFFAAYSIRRNCSIVQDTVPKIK